MSKSTLLVRVRNLSSAVKGKYASVFFIKDRASRLNFLVPENSNLFTKDK